MSVIQVEEKKVETILSLDSILNAVSFEKEVKEKDSVAYHTLSIKNEQVEFITKLAMLRMERFNSKTQTKDVSKEVSAILFEMMKAYFEKGFEVKKGNTKIVDSSQAENFAQLQKFVIDFWEKGFDAQK